jgi:amidohydrolase
MIIQPLSHIKDLRKTLHQMAELSGNEHNTSRFLQDYLKRLNPDEIIANIGGAGFVVVFNGKEPGSTVALRTDMDALPIIEENSFKYRSANVGVSHKCGHDGHMAIMLAVAEHLSVHKPLKGKVMLVFQPEEETGTGALKMLSDTKFTQLAPDYFFALHNVPSYKAGSVLARNNSFASASVGVCFALHGKSSHAAEPENGNSPALAMSEIIQSLEKLPPSIQGIKDFILLTVIHAKLGERAFGTTPGYAQVMATLRSYRDDDLELLKAEAVSIVKTICKTFGLRLEIEWIEPFCATVNNNDLVKHIEHVAVKNGIEYNTLLNPFRWSEDFGYFLRQYKGAMFALGAGINHAQLHNPDYDFPDEIISVGANMFIGIVEEILNT